jgi:hypothetical protein
MLRACGLNRTLLAARSWHIHRVVVVIDDLGAVVAHCLEYG